MRARTVRKQRRVLVASLTATMVLPFVGGGVAYSLPTETGRFSAASQLTETAPRADAEHGMRGGNRGGYRAEGLRTRATTTATFLVPKFEATDCGPTDEAWADRRVYRHTQADEFYVQIWTHCTSGRLTAGGWWIGGSSRFLPEMSPGERLTVTSEGSRRETRLSVHNLDRGWVAEMKAPSAPDGNFALLANNQYDGDLPFLERTWFKRLRIDHRAFGEFAPERFETECTRVSPLREGTSFSVTQVCAP